MKPITTLTSLGLLATLAASSISPALADGYRSRSDQQDGKNTMRNLGIAGAAVAAFGLLNHNSTLTLLGAAGAALAGNQYEQDRQQQSQDDNGRYYHRDGYRSQDGYRYQNSGQYRDNTQYRSSTWDRNSGQYRDDNGQNRDRDRDDNGQTRDRDQNRAGWGR